MRAQAGERGLVSVVILNWNGEQYLRACIEGVLSQSYAPTELIVVDNGSTDRSLELLKTEYRGVRLVINERNLGFAEGMNTGIAASRGEFVLLLNEDVYLATDFLVCGVRELQVQPRLAWIGGRVCEWRNGERTDTLVNAAFALKRRFQLTTLPDSERRREALMASACAMLLRREALDDVAEAAGSWLDGQFFAYWEDTDLALRLWLRGWTCLFTPQMLCWHVVSGSVGGGRRLIDKPVALQRLSLRNRYRTMIKNVPTPVLIQLMPYLALVELLIPPYFALTSPRTMTAGLAAMWDTLRSLPALLNQRSPIQRRRVMSSSAFRRLFRGF